MTNAVFAHHPGTPRPRIGLDTYVVLDHAVVDLADRRFMKSLDAPVQLHLLTSLVAQAEVWLGEQVAAAREAGATWGEIGRLLGVTAAVARQRHAPNRATPRRVQPVRDRHSDDTTRTPLVD